VCADAEESARKELRRENQRKLRQVREQEKGRRDLACAEIKNR